MPFEKGQIPAGAEPFKKGQSGNPKGRTKGVRNVSTVLREMLQVLAPDAVIDTKFVKEFCKGKKKIYNADAQAARIMFEALVKGEAWAIKELLDRTEGKPAQAITGANGGPITNRVIFEVIDGGNGDNGDHENPDE